jgi:transposase
MRCELAVHEWAAIKPMLPNKPRGVKTADEAHDNRLAFPLLCDLQLASIRLWLRVNKSTP